MNIRCWIKQCSSIQRSFRYKFLVQWMFVAVFIISCNAERDESNWVDGDTLSISQYLEKNHEEFSMFYRLLAGGKMLGTLYAYNPYGEDYTLFLPTDKAIDNFIRQNQNYGNFEELLKDTSFIKKLTRYHIVNRKVNTNEFPDGALNDKTLTGDRLVIGFFKEADNQLIKVNNKAPIIKSNLKMTNGYIHVISEVLELAEIPGYDWLQRQDDYSILAQAMELTGIRKRLTWNKYTILAEHDSVYHRNGIFSMEDLIKRIATPGIPYSDRTNSLYQYTAYHILNKEFYLNDLAWGNKKYQTLSNTLLTINAGLEIQINPGIDTYGIKISETGEKSMLNYIRVKWDNSNIITLTGPVHSISDMLYFKPLPK